ncbi:hypothetical protein MPL3365_180249 [Mesorhizobium plurifarium]|uniref:Uncharacterized protein n=1 Tax=Mesorhizobium plurifarium TaxID=69974 RepID=A0A090G0I0_MESPL|nr:hypothetical protein MPL3365_180249 [Mesorhizobium plurifarium]
MGTLNFSHAVHGVARPGTRAPMHSNPRAGAHGPAKCDAVGEPMASVLGEYLATCIYFDVPSQQLILFIQRP